MKLQQFTEDDMLSFDRGSVVHCFKRNSLQGECRVMTSTCFVTSQGHAAAPKAVLYLVPSRRLLFETPGVEPATAKGHKGSCQQQDRHSRAY